MTKDPRVLAMALAIANTPVRCTPRGAKRPQPFASLDELPDEYTRQRYIEEAETAIAILEASGSHKPA